MLLSIEISSLSGNRTQFQGSDRAAGLKLGGRIVLQRHLFCFQAVSLPGEHERLAIFVLFTIAPSPVGYGTCLLSDTEARAGSEKCPSSWIRITSQTPIFRSATKGGGLEYKDGWIEVD
jgi:hypothetical protein